MIWDLPANTEIKKKGWVDGQNTINGVDIFNLFPFLWKMNWNDTQIFKRLPVSEEAKMTVINNTCSTRGQRKGRGLCLEKRGKVLSRQTLLDIVRATKYSVIHLCSLWAAEGKHFLLTLSCAETKCFKLLFKNNKLWNCWFNNWQWPCEAGISWNKLYILTSTVMIHHPHQKNASSIYQDISIKHVHSLFCSNFSQSFPTLSPAEALEVHLVSQYFDQKCFKN